MRVTYITYASCFFVSIRLSVFFVFLSFCFFQSMFVRLYFSFFLAYYFLYKKEKLRITLRKLLQKENYELLVMSGFLHLSTIFYFSIWSFSVSVLQHVRLYLSQSVYLFKTCLFLLLLQSVITVCLYLFFYQIYLPVSLALCNFLC